MLFGGDQFKREHQTAQFAAGCAFAHRQLRGAGERGEEEFDVVRSGGVQLFAFGHADLQFRSAHGQRIKFRGDFGREFLRRGSTPFAHSLRGFFRSLKQLGAFGFQLFDLFRRGVQILQIVYGLVPPRDHVGQFRPHRRVSSSSSWMRPLMASRSSTLASLSTSPDRLNTTSDRSVLMESSRSASSENTPST